MELDDVVRFFTQRGIQHDIRDIEYGKQVRASTGEMVTIYTSGRCVVQGWNSPLKQELLAWQQSGMQLAVPQHGGF